VSQQRLSSHDAHTPAILAHIALSDHVSQRSIAKDVGIALGLTNLLLSRLVEKRWVRVVREQPNRVRYLLTRAGVAARDRMERERLNTTVRSYSEVRTRIRESLNALATAWPTSQRPVLNKRIVFYGTGMLAEIGYVCLHETSLRLVGVVDDQQRSRFFDVPVRTASDLCGRTLDGAEFDCLVVMSFEHLEQAAAALRAANVPARRVHWL
jgi:DNA-binding MarR family transcriptional regulator